MWGKKLGKGKSHNRVLDRSIAFAVNHVVLTIHNYIEVACIDMDRTILLIFYRSQKRVHSVI